MHFSLAKRSTLILFALALSGTFSAALGSTSANTKGEDTARYLNADWNLSVSNVGIGYATSIGTEITLDPTLQYFILPFLSIGLTSSLTTNFTKDRTSLDLGPAITYFLPTTSHWKFYGLGSFTFTNLTQSQGLGIHHTITLGAGFNYQLADWFGLGPRLNVNFMTDPGAAPVTVTASFLNLFFFF